VNWQAVGAIGEVLGSIAVFATLGYLAVQLRHARQEVRRSMSQSRAEAHRDTLAMFREPQVLALWVKANVAEEGVRRSAFAAHAMEHWKMTREEAVLLLLTMTSAWQQRLELIPYVADLSPMERHEFEQVIRAVYGRPGAQRKFYELYIKETQHPDAVRYVESVLGEAG
jgi:hypothetical protein